MNKNIKQVNGTNYEVEYRKSSHIELRETEDGRVTVGGYAAVFNQIIELWGGKEVIATGAFAADLPGADIRMLLNHEDLPIARTTAGDLRVWEDDHGLAFEADLDPADPDSAKIITKIRNKHITQMSFAFWVLKDDIRTDDDGDIIRTLQRVTLDDGDVSPVTYPAYKGTEISLRAKTCIEKLQAINAARLGDDIEANDDEAVLQQQAAKDRRERHLILRKKQ